MKITFEELMRRVNRMNIKIPIGYGVPKSGMLVALLVGNKENLLYRLEDVDAALAAGHEVAIIDDVKDSGRTEEKLKKRFAKHLDKITFFYVVDKQKEGITEWVTFPWNDFEELKDEEDQKLRDKQKKGIKTY